MEILLKRFSSFLCVFVCLCAILSSGESFAETKWVSIVVTHSTQKTVTHSKPKLLFSSNYHTLPWEAITNSDQKHTLSLIEKQLIYFQNNHLHYIASVTSHLIRRLLIGILSSLNCASDQPSDSSGHQQHERNQDSVELEGITLLTQTKDTNDSNSSAKQVRHVVSARNWLIFEMKYTDTKFS